MNELKCEKVERELELNGQKAKFVASTLNLDYVLIDNILYLGLDCYDKVIKDVRAEFASDEAIRTRAERIVAANAAFEFVAVQEYMVCRIAVYAKENLGYVALHTSDNLLYVQFVDCDNLGRDDINNIPKLLPTKRDFCQERIKDYQKYLETYTVNRRDNYAWKDNRFMQMSQEINEYDDVTVTQCEENSFWSPCLNCKKDIDYSFKPQSEPITTCPHCGAEFIVSTSIQATANYYIERVLGGEMKEKFTIKATEKGIDFRNVRAKHAINVACSILEEAAKAQGLTFRISKNEKGNLTVELIREAK